MPDETSSGFYDAHRSIAPLLFSKGRVGIYSSFTYGLEDILGISHALFGKDDALCMG